MSDPLRADDTAPNSLLAMKLPIQARILIVSDNDVDSEGVSAVFREAGLACEIVRTITAACEVARSGGIHVVFCTPYLQDGSWRRMIDLACYHNLGFEVVLLARAFSDKEWAEALQEGVYDVLDAVSDLPRVAGVAKSALGADYLRRFRPRQKLAA